MMSVIQTHQPYRARRVARTGASSVYRSRIGRRPLLYRAARGALEALEYLGVFLGIICLIGLVYVLSAVIFLQ